MNQVHFYLDLNYLFVAILRPTNRERLLEHSPHQCGAKEPNRDTNIVAFFVCEGRGGGGGGGGV